MFRGVTTTEDVLRTWENDGLIFPIRVLSPEQSLHFRQCTEELELQLGGSPRTIETRQMHLHFPWAWQLASNANVLNAVEELLGPDIIVWATELFIKRPHEPAISIGWHRDVTYMGFEPNSSATAWIALSNSSIANGCMQAFPGPDRRLHSPDVGTPINVVLRAGEMSLHDDEILHGSAGNHSDDKRIGFVVRYVNPQGVMRSAAPEGIVARGSCNFAPFRSLCPPGESDEEAALLKMKASAVRHFDTMLKVVQKSKSHAAAGIKPTMSEPGKRANEV